jgi:carboxymethylenebutenolidase
MLQRQQNFLLDRRLPALQRQQNVLFRIGRALSNAALKSPSFDPWTKGAPLMERKKASDFPPEVLKLFDGYVHGRITRRDFLDNVGKFAVGGFTAAAMLESLRPNYAFAQQVAKDDSRIKTEYVTYPSPKGSGTMRGYLARPANAAGKLPGVVVIHENRGLNPYIEDVARRLAVDGFLAFAPDALTPVGGYQGDDEKAAQLFSQLDPAKRTEDLAAAADYLKARPDCTGKIGAVGFCFGGTIVNTFAVRMPDLAAAVPFYGGQPSATDAAKIKAPLLIHYAGNDDRINAGWPAYEAALKANGVKYQMFMYPGTQHGFHNDTTPRYDEAAAKLAWSRTVAFLKANLTS